MIEPRMESESSTIISSSSVALIEMDLADDQISFPETAMTDEGSVHDTEMLCWTTACHSCQGLRMNKVEDGESPRGRKSAELLSCRPFCSGGVDYYTICQVRCHNSEESCWLIAGDTIYDVTNYLRFHPGGAESLLKKAGGAADCTRDIEFHSKRATNLTKKMVVGKLRKCQAVSSEKDPAQWWKFW